MAQDKYNLSTVLQETWLTVAEVSRKTPLPHWNESVNQADWRTRDDGHISHRYLVLFYGDSHDMVGPKSYAYWYDSIKLPADTRRKATLTTVQTFDGLYCPVWEAECTCKLLEVH